MKNRFLLGILLVLTASSALADIKTITLYNNTSCKLVDNKATIVPAVDIYSEYNFNYYSTIPANKSGLAAIDPAEGRVYLTSSLSGDTLEALPIPEGHVFQTVITGTPCTIQNPCLDIYNYNPCQ